jgi:hypothetical protein
MFRPTNPTKSPQKNRDLRTIFRKLKDARERYESIHDQNLFSHVLAPKRPKNFQAKSQPKRRTKKHQVISPNICSTSTTMGPECRAWREVSDEDTAGTSRRLGFGGGVKSEVNSKL